MHFDEIRKTVHYKKNHEKKFPWPAILQQIFAVKNPRKKGDEIETKSIYILCELKEKVLYVINAKHKK